MTLLNEKKHSKAIDEFLVSIGMPRFFTFFLRITPGWKRTVKLAPTLLYDITLTENIPNIARLSKINIPIRIVYGEKSPEGIKKVASLISQNISSSELHEAASQDHMVDTNIILQEMIPFFK
ncbi:hypothetical protein CH366_01050 [Leptospira harrisiae]|uniref:Alpha/beta hydrolase n=1 Tax=Leptospira harrisiae TaxID=2023189 RepID=A0A2N0AKW9_9LEPT|nr:hypothetical protein CH364_01050 [Leptospira harrisiae]PKA08400.1 hypothetical protein CH366_01050 [Leptospira harrisiae]